GGRWDITEAARQLVQKAADGQLNAAQGDEAALHAHTCLADLRPLDLLIRTGGELRISNVLLWQCAYAELYFSDKLWPDFDGDELKRAVANFHERQRRFGMTGDQIEAGALNA